METLLINTIIAVLIGIIPYLVKYKKKYNLISGNTDYKEGNVTETDAIKQKANLLSNYIFLFCGLLIFLPTLLLFIPFESTELKLHKDLLGLYIIVLSALLSGIAYVLHNYLQRSKLKL